MARTADKPGTFRIHPKQGGFLLSGVRSDGQRVKVPGLSTRAEADEMGRRLFVGNAPTISPIVGASPTATIPPIKELDDWGVPIRVSADTIGSVGAAIGVQPSVSHSTPLPQAQNATPKPDDVKPNKAKRAKQAASLMELAGIGWAAGSCWVGRATCEAMDKEPVKPNEQQVRDLAEVTKETFVDWFGDREIKPWQMMFLLTLGIPVSMVIQSKGKKKETDEKPALRSVP